MSNTSEIKELPYGIADYQLIRSENYYYVDKTPYLPTIKKAGRYLFFIRPRRFGKSLLLSMMETYYDVMYKENFEKFFKGTWIYDHPTEDRGAYLILKFNFSLVDPDLHRIETSFLTHVQGVALSFARKYNDLLPANRDYFVRTVEESRSASDILSALIRLCQDSGQKLYVIIDEYDNFANTILSTSGKKAYEQLTHGTGAFRAFFNVLKGGTTDAGAPFSRLFLTGVSPITLDDVTSGYNIGKNVSLEPNFNRMLGFTHDDVNQMLRYYSEKQQVRHSIDQLQETLCQWYDNYLFSEDDDQTLFNADMVLYFLDYYLTRKKFPNDLIDRNVRIDYGKLRHLIIVDRGKARPPSINGNFSKLKEIIEKGETFSQLATAFPLEKLVAPDNFKSLLFYFGLLTIKEADRGRLRLTIPNETAKQLFYKYIEDSV